MTCTNVGYTGQNYCDKNSRFGKPTGLGFAIDGNTFAAADFLLQANFEDGVQAQQIFPLQNMKGFEDLSTEAQYHDYDDGTRKLMEQGNYRFSAHFDLNECTKKQLLNFRGFQQGLYMFYGDVIRGRTIDAGVNVIPVRIADINIEKATLPTMSDREMVKVVIDLVSDKDLNEYDYSRKMAWDVADLDGLTEVTLSLPAGVTQTATLLTVDVSADCGGQNKQISGLGVEVADWTLVIAGGTFTSVSESPTVRGRYLFIVVGAANADTVDLASPVDRSDTVMAISSGSIAIAGIA